MDDFNVTNLYESKNEWANRLVNILTPLVTEGFTSILDESYKLCTDNDEEEKYLMTFQNMISNIPSWSSTTVCDEKNRIIESSGCDYMSDLITCVHVIQLKILTCVRVGHKQKPIEIDIPSLEKFIHKVYINVARRLYSNVYLFEKDILPLQVQKHNRELEIIIKECILNTVRDSIPVQEILRAYLDETTEEDITEEINEVIEEPKSDISTGTTSQLSGPPHSTPQSPAGSVPALALAPATLAPAPATIAPALAPAHLGINAKSLKFSDTDERISTENIKEDISAPKDIDTLERISNERAEKDDDDEESSLTIHDAGDISLDILDINDINRPISLNSEILIPDIEVL